MKHESLTITGCTVADGAALAYNNMSAFWLDPYYLASWKHTTLEKQIIEVGKRIPRNLLNDRDTLRHQKAVDASGKIVGYARWDLPKSAAVIDGTYAWPDATVPAVSSEEEAEIRKIAAEADWHPNSDEDDSEFDAKITEAKKRLLEGSRYIYLDYLAVHPDQQGKGIASALVASGLHEAKVLGLDVLVLAFPQGFRLYEKLGFRILETVTAGSKYYGGNYSMRFMSTASEHS